MAWHADCYNATHDRTAVGKIARYESRCEAETCKHGGRIMPGQSYTWTRRFPEGAKDQGSSSVQTSADPIMSALAQLVVPVIEEKIASQLAECDPEKIATEVMQIVQSQLSSIQSLKVEIVTPDLSTKDLGVQHKQFPTLVKAMAARTNVWLAGPSGSGKTTAAMAAAKALDLSFRYTGAVSDPFALLGFKDATGQYRQTPFRESWEHGGVFLWDEVDASDPNALLAFNACLANGHAAFPDGIIERHKDCILVAAANTYGHGATHEYVGRMKLDAAFLKRFAFISWDYDEKLELATAPNPTWTKRVQQVRKRVREKGLRVLVTPRESYIGAQLLAAGISQSDVEDMTIRSGMTADQWGQVS